MNAGEQREGEKGEEEKSQKLKEGERGKGIGRRRGTSWL